MGYRHQVMSETYPPNINSLPKWFRDKYEEYFHIHEYVWVTVVEYKMHGEFGEIFEDLSRALKEIDSNDEIQFICYSSDGDPEWPDLYHVMVSKDSVIETRSARWE